jgi:hypothetical protein
MKSGATGAGERAPGEADDICSLACSLTVCLP